MCLVGNAWQRYVHSAPTKLPVLSNAGGAWRRMHRVAAKGSLYYRQPGIYNIYISSCLECQILVCLLPQMPGSVRHIVLAPVSKCADTTPGRLWRSLRQEQV